MTSINKKPNIFGDSHTERTAEAIGLGASDVPKRAFSTPDAKSLQHKYNIRKRRSKEQNYEIRKILHTAFSFRNAIFLTSIDLEWLAPDNGVLEENLQWLDKFHDEMEKFTSANAYVNFIDNRQKNHLESYFGDKVEKLKAIRRQLDPDNIFSNPQSIPV